MPGTHTHMHTAYTFTYIHTACVHALSHVHAFWRDLNLIGEFIYSGVGLEVLQEFLQILFIK